MTPRVPFEELSRLARHEAHRKSLHRPPYYLHKWWARRTGTVLRGMLLDMLLPPDEDVMANFYRPHNFLSTTVLDPFMGGGTTLGEGIRLGCRVIGCDVNPVAWFLVQRSLQSLDRERVDAAFAAVECKVAFSIADLYSATCSVCQRSATIQNVAWVTQIRCRACGELVDLSTNQVVMRSFSVKTPHLVECPECHRVFSEHTLEAPVSCPKCDHHFVPNVDKCASTDYLCRCGHQEAIVRPTHRLSRPLPRRLRALTIWCESCGRVHQSPSRSDEAAFRAIEADARQRWRSLLIPRQRIPAGRNTDQLRRYGYRFWHQLFNARELVALDLLFRAIQEVEDVAAREVLLLIASASLEFNSMLCTAKGLGTGAVRQVFTHHAFIPAKAPLEANVWGVASSSGGFATLYRERVGRSAAWASNPIELRPTPGGKTQRVEIPGEELKGRLAKSFHDLQQGDANLLLLNQSSERLSQIPDASVDLIVTDPPYADMVMYSELSDYFYVWLRLLLNKSYPQSFSSSLVDDRREAVQNDERRRDGDFYAQLVGTVFHEAGRTLKTGGRLVFTFHHAGEHGWRYIEDALVRGGFAVERWWPVFAEMESGVTIRGKNSGGHLDIVFVCGKPAEVLMVARTESDEELGARLSEHFPLVAADFRALHQATRVQAATWKRLTDRSPLDHNHPVATNE